MIKLTARASALMHPFFWALIAVNTALVVVMAIAGDWLDALNQFNTGGLIAIVAIQTRKIERLRAANPEPVGFN